MAESSESDQQPKVKVNAPAAVRPWALVCHRCSSTFGGSLMVHGTGSTPRHQLPRGAGDPRQRPIPMVIWRRFAHDSTTPGVVSSWGETLREARSGMG